MDAFRPSARPYADQASEFMRRVYLWMGAGLLITAACAAGVASLPQFRATVFGSYRIVILLILNAGSVMNQGYEKASLLQNELNKEASEIISTYVYKQGLMHVKYSFSAAVGLFNSVINCVLLFVTNFIAGRLGETRLF